MSERSATGWPPAGIVVFLLVLTAFRFAVAHGAGLAEDEAYYWLWSLNPAPGYLDHAPAVAWVIAAGTALAGDTELGVRLFGPLAVLIGSLALWRTAALLFERRTANLAVLWFNATLFIAAGAVVMTPDTPAVLAWGLSLWALAELHVSRNPKWWLAVGVFAGLGLVSKYSVLFLGAGLVLWLLATADGRKWLNRWELWAGGAIAVVLLLPVVEWNRAHDWASFLKQMGRGARAGGFDPRFLPEVLGAFIALATPFIAGFGVWGIWRGLRLGHAGSLLLILTSAPFLAYLVWHGLFTRVQPNWLAPLLPAFALLAASATAAIGELDGRAKATARGFAGLAAPLGLGLSAVLYLHVTIPVVTLEGRRDPTNQMRGWADFAGEVAWRAEEQEADYIATTSYGTTAQLAWALRGRPDLPVIQLDERLRYVHLPPPDPALFAGRGLYVELARREDTARLQDRFEFVTRFSPLERRFRGTRLAAYQIAVLGPATAAPLGPIAAP